MRDALVIEAASGDAQLAEIRALAHTVWRAHYPGIISPEQVEYMLERDYSMDALRRDLVEREVRFDCARIEGALVGFSAYAPQRDPGALMLHKLYVEAARRGCGIARELVDAAARYARASSLDRIVLRVNKRNLLAIAAYERLGFSKQGSITSDIGGGFEMDDYLMKRDL